MIDYYLGKVIPRDMPADSNRTPLQCEDYDVQIRKTMPYYETMHQEILNLALCLDRVPELWLDTGCGTGTFVRRRAVDALPTTKFILTDPFSGMGPGQGKAGP